MGPFLCLGQGLVPFLGLPIDPSTPPPHTHTTSLESGAPHRSCGLFNVSGLTFSHDWFLEPQVACPLGWCVGSPGGLHHQRGGPGLTHIRKWKDDRAQGPGASSERPQHPRFIQRGNTCLPQDQLLPQKQRPNKGSHSRQLKKRKKEHSSV